jgi:hypothetical protein
VDVVDERAVEGGRGEAGKVYGYEDPAAVGGCGAGYGTGYYGTGGGVEVCGGEDGDVCCGGVGGLDCGVAAGTWGC